MKIKSAIIILFNLIFFGCEEDKVVAITDNPVYAVLIARYTESTKTTFGSSSFWEGGPGGRRLIFDSGSKLSFNDVAMDYNSVDYSYTKSLLGFYGSSTFKITDVNNKTFENTITINTINLPASNALDTIDSSHPLTIAWTGSALQSNETVTLRIAGVGAKQDTVGRTTVTFSLNDFSALNDVKGTTVDLSIERSKTLTLSQDLGGSGNIKAEYIAQTKQVYLK
jgi:hypothetical protein